MRQLTLGTAVGFACLALAACAGTGTSPIATGAVGTEAPAGTAAVRGTPVVGARPARVYVVVGFKEADCAAVAPTIQVTTPPSKGSVSFKPNQITTVQFSASGKCTGKQLPGTGIYYTARSGETGPDSFTVSAATSSGQPTVKSFQVRIVE